MNTCRFFSLVSMLLLMIATTLLLFFKGIFTRKRLVIWEMVHKWIKKNVIKVFRLNRRPYCYSSVSFSLLLLFFFLTRFLQNAWTDFHEIFRDGVYWSRKTENNFCVMTSLPVRDIDDFLILRVSFCDAISSETTQDIFFKFSRMIDKGLKFIPFESQLSSLKSAEAR